MISKTCSHFKQDGTQELRFRKRVTGGQQFAGATAPGTGIGVSILNKWSSSAGTSPAMTMLEMMK